MGTLPNSRTITLAPLDPFPSNLGNELQDNLVALQVAMTGGSQALWPLNTSLLGNLTTGGDLTVGGQLLPFADFTFTADSATDLCTAANHPLQTGAGPIRTSNSGGGLPGGLAAATDYFAIKASSSTFKLATSQVNALAGTAIDITTNGTGTQTLNHQTTTARISDATVTRDLTVGGNIHLSGVGRVTHGTRTLQLQIKAPSSGVGNIDPQTGVTSNLLVRIPALVGWRITLLRARIKDSATGPTKMAVELWTANATQQDGSSFVTSNTGTASAGNGTGQIITSTAMAVDVVSGTIYALNVPVTTGSASCSVFYAEVDYIGI